MMIHARRVAAAATVLLLSLALGVVPAGAVPRSPHPRTTDYGARGTLAATWQGTQLVQGHVPGFGGNPDWGLTIDTAFMLAADGSQPAVLAKVRRAVSPHVLDYAVFGGKTSAGALAKVLLAAAVLAVDPADVDGVDVRRRVLALVAPAGAGFEAGRLRDTGSSDASNVFAQAFGVLGLARTGAVPQSTVDYLLKQQCADGYFRIFETAGRSCDRAGSGADVDATSLALQALLAARADGADVPQQAVSGTADWLLTAQNPDGSFAELGTGAGNSNSTGLGAEALAAVGRVSSRLKAAAWVAAHQVTRASAGSGPAKPDIGAIAYDAAGYADGIAHGLGSNRAQWRRATPEGFFAFVPVPLGVLTAP